MGRFQAQELTHRDALCWEGDGPRDSEEYSLAPDFKSVNSLAVSLLYGPTLTPIQDF